MGKIWAGWIRIFAVGLRCDRWYIVMFTFRAPRLSPSLLFSHVDANPLLSPERLPLASHLRRHPFWIASSQCYQFAPSHHLPKGYRSLLKGYMSRLDHCAQQTRFTQGFTRSPGRRTPKHRTHSRTPTLAWKDEPIRAHFIPD